MTFFCVVSPFGLISPGTAWFINKHKTISWLNYQQESPRRWRGRASIWGCPQFITPLSLRFESLSSDFHVVSDTVNMKWHLIMMNVWSDLQDNKQDEKLFVGFFSSFFFFFLQIIPRETHTNSTHMAHERKAIFLINNSLRRLIERDAAWAGQCQMKTQEDISHNFHVHVIEEKYIPGGHVRQFWSVQTDRRDGIFDTRRLTISQL